MSASLFLILSGTYVSPELVAEFGRLPPCFLPNGTRRLYDWLDDNGAVEMLPVDIVNDPRRIAMEEDFMSINATTEVDLYGQCASETIAGRYWSSSGGQADFARGAMYARGGKAFVVLHSTTSKGRSRIRVRY